MHFEALEERTVLSVSAAGMAYPTIMMAPSASPLASAGPTGMTPAQIRHAYGFDQVAFGSTAADGTGTTIAIVDAYNEPNIVNDLHQFDVQFGLKDPTLTIENENGGTTLPVGNTGWGGEIALDVEWAHAVAPGAKILLVEANTASGSDLYTAVVTAAKTPGVVVVSNSYGIKEYSSETADDTVFTTPAGHAPVTFLASSGDKGAPVSYPASSPNVVAVGGTSLYLSGGNYGSEAGWSGSGGGISAYETQPAYQKGVVTQTTSRRANPDVSYDSDPGTGFPVYNSYGSSSPWGQWGGTSDASPQWAALIAIADQGRAQAGLQPLDGVKDTLPKLYALPATDFHDVTTGSSTGSPSYAAGKGYDLVTGRGTPYANLVINDLVGSSTPAPTATHLSITATPSSITAGQSFSITVSALGSSNSVNAAYADTVQIACSDPNATLPQSYTFTAADKGVHTFTGVTMVTAGNQTVQITDTTNTSITGTQTIAVAAAAANHLVFGQQPTSTAVGGLITPGVTVKVLDRYNNVVTADNSDVITLALANNPSGANLSGTTATAVINGVAAFNTLSINTAGTGYTLAATSGGAIAGATSAAFSVATALPTTIESFESNSLAGYYYVGGSRPNATPSTAAAHDGKYGLSYAASSAWIYRGGSVPLVQAGDTLTVWMKFAGTNPTGRSYFGFGASAAGTLSIVAAPNTNNLILQSNSGYGYTDLASVNQAWTGNVWYRLELDWGSSGKIVGKLFAADGVTLLNSVTATSTAITGGGIAFRAIGTTTYFDTVQDTPAVNTSSVTASSAAPARTAAAAAVAASTSSLLATSGSPLGSILKASDGLFADPSFLTGLGQVLSQQLPW